MNVPGSTSVVVEEGRTNNETVYCKKIFIYRDYGEGTAVKFLSKYPVELEGRVI